MSENRTTEIHRSQGLGGSHILAGLSSLGVPGVPWHTHILTDQLTLFQPGGTDYAHLITTGTPGFLDLPTALNVHECEICKIELTSRVTLWMDEKCSSLKTLTF